MSRSPASTSASVARSPRLPRSRPRFVKRAFRLGRRPEGDAQAVGLANGGVAAGPAEARRRLPVAGVDAAWPRRDQGREPACVGLAPGPRVGLDDGQVLERVVADAEARVN